MKGGQVDHVLGGDGAGGHELGAVCPGAPGVPVPVPPKVPGPLPAAGVQKAGLRPPEVCGQRKEGTWW